MTDDHFHKESLEEFKSQLTAEGFEPVVSSDPVRWRGPLHPAFASLSEATTMDIVIRAGWPFQPPVLLVEGLDSNHSTLGGYVCMWRYGDPSLEWSTVPGFFSRIEAWCENARTGWAGDGLGYDAFLNFHGQLVLQRRFLNSVSFWPEIASRKARLQSCQARWQVAMKRCSRSLSGEPSL